MGSNRIQKLLFTEYSDMQDMVLLESPFAQTTKDGRGIRQVQIGITPSKLLLASDYLEQDDPTLKVDPEISTLELLSMLPIECVNISVYRRRTRNTIKAHFCNDQVLYFELACPNRRELQIVQNGQSLKQVSGPLHHTPVTTDRQDNTNLYLGKKISQLKPNLNVDTEKWEEASQYKEISERPTVQTIQHVNRFGAGINENCAANLFLSGKIEKPVSAPAYCSGKKQNDEPLDLAEEAVRVWEQTAKIYKKRRRYGIVPMAYHLNGLGTVNFSKAEAVSTQMRRWSSELRLNYKNEHDEFDFCVQKRQLVSSLSFDCLLKEKNGQNELMKPIRCGTKYNYSQGFLLYWTPKYSYGRQTQSKSYRVLLKHLNSVHRHIKSTGVQKKRFPFTMKINKRRMGFFDKEGGGDAPNKSDPTCSSFLIDNLEMDITLSSWDFDSTILSYQLTLIDRDLFLNITGVELEAMIFEKNSSNAPAFKHMVDFAERVSNLIATEIIRVDSVKMRARMMSKFINVTDKLHRLHNMQSAHSVLIGLQHPAVYRLKKTWCYLKQHYTTKYQRLCQLLKVYRETRSKLFYRLFERFSRTTPYIPSIHFLCASLLGHLPSAQRLLTASSYHSICKSCTSVHLENLWNVQSKLSVFSETTVNKSSQLSTDSEGLIKQLDSYFRLICESEFCASLRLEATRESLAMWQEAVAGYDLIENHLAKEFLLKARYSEGHDLLQMSVNIEPSEE
ncbi:uncharacterized protein LOC106669770, partial [Cimex lectularius]|uniref:Ras-GEF domain-containing protein n=1 Tax=Cimex lectularius TaxID=79782 RepID=A0A8I6S2T4_CIMLE